MEVRLYANEAKCLTVTSAKILFFYDIEVYRGSQTWFHF